MASFTKEIDSRLAKRSLVFNGGLANRGLTSLVKETAGDVIQNGRFSVTNARDTSIWDNVEIAGAVDMFVKHGVIALWNNCMLVVYQFACFRVNYSDVITWIDLQNYWPFLISIWILTAQYKVSVDGHTICLWNSGSVIVNPCCIVVFSTFLFGMDNEHYSDVIMSAMAYQITSIWSVCSTVCSSVDQRKHQSSASLAFARGIHRLPVNSRTEGQ